MVKILKYKIRRFEVSSKNVSRFKIIEHECLYFKGVDVLWVDYLHDKSITITVKQPFKMIKKDGMRLICSEKEYKNYKNKIKVKK